MILSAAKIEAAVKAGDIFINPFNRENLKKSSYTFTLGDLMKRPRRVECIDSRTKFEEFDLFAFSAKGYLMQPGEFGIFQTTEMLKLSEKIACFLTMRGAKAQMGLDALQCEIFCEPGSEGGWEGKLMLEMSNRGPCPIRLFPGIPIVKAIFMSL